MAEPCEDPISGQKHGTEYNECRRNRLMEQWSALSIKESGGTLFQEKMSEMTTVAHLTPCSFSTSPYQILLSPALDLRAFSAQNFSNRWPFSPSLCESHDKYRPLLPKPNELSHSCPPPSHTRDHTVLYIRAMDEWLRESGENSDLI